MGWGEAIGQGIGAIHDERTRHTRDDDSYKAYKRGLFAEGRADAFERQRVQMVVADARAAGISPLAALGVSAGNPVMASVGQTESGSARGDAIAQAASNIGSAIDSQRAEDQVTKESNSRIKENEARTNLLNVQAGDIIAQQARDSQNKLVDRSLSNDTSEVKKSLVTPLGKEYTPGLGSTAADLENEYGEIADLEGGFRYIRDRVGEPFAHALDSYLEWRRKRRETQREFLEQRDRAAFR